MNGRRTEQMANCIINKKSDEGIKVSTCYQYRPACVRNSKENNFDDNYNLV